MDDILLVSLKERGAYYMDLLEVKSISKTYGSGETAVHALNNVSFSVPKGEFVAIVGESGSGKSTLLNMLGALDTPTSGKVFFEDHTDHDLRLLQIHTDAVCGKGAFA